MTEEEKSQTEEAAADAGEAPAAEESEPAAEAPAEDAGGEPTAEAAEPEAESAEPEGESAEAEGEGPEPEGGAEPEAAEPEAPLGPKERRRRARSRSQGTPRPPRTAEERAAERAARRRAAALARRRYRAARRAKEEGPREGTPPAERSPGTRKVRLGTVVSSKADKTITVRIETARRHPVYEKVVRRSSTLHAHDERNEAHEGDVVRVVETRPLSRTKRWRLLEIVERAR